MSGRLKTHVRFSSDRFPQTEDEREDESGQANEALASAIYQGLVARGIPAEAPYGESWGNIIEIRNDEFRLSVGCAHDGGEHSFQAFVHPNEPEIRLGFWRGSTVEPVSKVRAALEATLAAAGITNVEWTEG